MHTNPLQDIGFGFSKAINQDILLQTRDMFYKALLETPVAIKVHNKDTVRCFTEKDATELSNFFFHEMFGPAALKRLRALIKEYNVPQFNSLYRKMQRAMAEDSRSDVDVPLHRPIFDDAKKEYIRAVEAAAAKHQ